MSDMEYKVEDIIKGREALQELAQKCWDEVDQAKGIMSFDPDWRLYNQYNNAGHIRYYTAYGDEGKQEGFAIFLITPSLHCKNKFVAVSDSIYLTKQYRSYGAEFINLIIDDLREEQVDWFSLHIKSWADSGRLGTAIDCTHCENVYQRGLQ